MFDYDKMNLLFSSTYHKATPIEFNKEWSGGLGYLDYITDSMVAPKIDNGKIMRSLTPSGRRILVIGTRIGNVAVYDRWMPNDKSGMKLFVTNMPSSVKRIFILNDMVLTVSAMISILGDSTSMVENIGMRIDNMLKAIKCEQEVVQA